MAATLLLALAHEHAGAQTAPTVDCSKVPAGHDFRGGGTLLTPNLARQNLRGANFSGVTLVGAAFICADFTNATFQAQLGQVSQTDFSFANLSGAKFTRATFDAPTYFTYATLTSADFSHTDISTTNAIFGDEPLVFDAAATPRLTFANATMSCEFIDQWRDLDLSGAVLGGCIAQLAGRNFSGAVMAGVDLTGARLDGAQLTGADLSGAVLDRASLQCGPASDGSGARCVDLYNARMLGTSLNNANLSGASLYGAFLSNSDGGNAASMIQAHLKNVNLSAAQLSGVDFTRANFYGNTSANTAAGCTTTGPNYSGFTRGCATAHNATMVTTKFAEAYLYGVDFTTAKIASVSFDQAVVIGANFAGATIGTFSLAAGRTAFTRAHLEGTNLDKAAALDADLSDAFVDFRAGGNITFVLLDGGNHNTFACSDPPTCKPPTGQDVCVWVNYPVTTVPDSNANLKCPDGTSSGADVCGAASSAGNHWKGSLDATKPPSGVPPAWYQNPPSFGSTTSGAPPRCNGGAPVPRW